jgi:hypothetical protein
LLFVITDILLPPISAFIDDTEVATMQNTRIHSVLYFDGENAGGIFRVIISPNGESIRIGDLIKPFAKNVPDFVRVIFLIGVIHFDIHIKVKTNIGVPVTGYHPPLAAAYKMILKGKVFSDFVLQSVNDI